MSGRLEIVQGGQYGSEGKGNIVHTMVRERDGRWDAVVRVGGPNAGHTIWYEGKRWQMRQLPVGWTQPGVQLVVAAGSVVSPTVLRDEIERVQMFHPELLVMERLWVDPRAVVHWDKHTELASVSGRTAEIGSTGEGVSEAYMDRIRNRGEPHSERTRMGGWFGGLLIPESKSWSEEKAWWGPLIRAANLSDWLHDGQNVLVESTQGALLDVTFGDWPYTTHRQTTPSQWLADIGIPPTYPNLGVTLVVRTYPIRVAGQSGPLPMETTWERVARSQAGSDLMTEEQIDAYHAWDDHAAKILTEGCGGCYPTGWTPNPAGVSRFAQEQTAEHQHGYLVRSYLTEALERLTSDERRLVLETVETTTVTGLVRRIGLFDWDQYRRSVGLCGPTSIALTFCDYEWPEAQYDLVTRRTSLLLDIFTSKLASIAMAPVRYRSWGPRTEDVERLPWR